MVEIFVALFLHQFAIPATNDFDHRKEEKVASTPGLLNVEVGRPLLQAFRPGDQRVPVLNLRLEASCAGEIAVHSLNVLHRGMGSATDIESIYVLDGTERISSGRQLNRDGSVSIALSQYVLPACSTKELAVAIDVSAQAAVAGEHWFTIPQSSFVDSDAISVSVVSATKPSRQRAIGPARGTIDVEYPAQYRTVRYGSSQVVARLRLRADNVQDHSIRALTFTNMGSARDDDLQNIYLEAGAGRRVSSIVPSLSSDTVRLVFDPPFLLTKNQERLLTLRADVRVGRSRTMQFLIEEPGDIESGVHGKRRQ